MIGNLVTIVNMLKIKVTNGYTKTNRKSYKTIKLPCIRPDVTREEIIFFIDILRPLLVGEIVSVDLVTEKTTKVWTPEMREEKLENEEELSGAESARTARNAQGAQSTQSSGATAQAAQSGNVAAGSSPVQSNGTVHTPAAVMGEAAEAQVVPKKAPPAHRRARTILTNGLPPLDDDGSTLFTVPGMPGMLFKLEQPKPEPTAEVGIAEPLRKLDAPLYGELPGGV